MSPFKDRKISSSSSPSSSSLPRPPFNNSQRSQSQGPSSSSLSNAPSSLKVNSSENAVEVDHAVSLNDNNSMNKSNGFHPLITMKNMDTSMNHSDWAPVTDILNGNSLFFLTR